MVAHPAKERRCRSGPRSFRRDAEPQTLGWCRLWEWKRAIPSQPNGRLAPSLHRRYRERRARLQHLPAGSAGTRPRTFQADRTPPCTTFRRAGRRRVGLRPGSRPSRGTARWSEQVGRTRSALRSSFRAALPGSGWRERTADARDGASADSSFRGPKVQAPSDHPTPAPRHRSARVMPAFRTAAIPGVAQRGLAAPRSTLAQGQADRRTRCPIRRESANRWGSNTGLHHPAKPGFVNTRQPGCSTGRRARVGSEPRRPRVPPSSGQCESAAAAPPGRGARQALLPAIRRQAHPRRRRSGSPVAQPPRQAADTQATQMVHRTP